MTYDAKRGVVRVRPSGGSKKSEDGCIQSQPGVEGTRERQARVRAREPDFFPMTEGRMRTVCGWFACALLLAGCGSNDGRAESGLGGGGPVDPPKPPEGQPTPPGPTTPPAPSPMPGQGKAFVRVVHASPDAPAVDVYVKGVANPILKALTYGDATKYLEVDEGMYDFELRASPSTAKDPVAYSTGTIQIRQGTKNTAIAAGLLASNDAQSKFRVVALADGNNVVSPGKSLVRIVHAGSDAPSVGIDVGNDNPAAPEISNLDRFADIDGVQLPSGASLQIGIGAGGKRVTAFTTPKLPDGGEILVIATGLLGKLPREKNGFALLAVGEGGAIGFIKQNPYVYALHAGVDAPAVDAYAGTTRAIANLSFGQLAGPLQVPAGDLKLRIFGANANPSGTAVAEPFFDDLQAGERYLAIATGYLTPPANGQPFQVLAFAEGFDLADAQKNRSRVVHASPNAPAVDVGPYDGTAASITPAAANIMFGKASAAEGLSLPPQNLLIGVSPAGANNTVVARFTLPTPAGARSFVVAAGALGHSTRPFRLALVDTSKNPWAVSHVFSH